MPTIAMFYGIIIRMYLRLASTLRLTFMCITLSIKQRLIFVLVRLLTASCPKNRLS